MGRIGLAVVLALTLMLPPAGEAQPAGKTARMGILAFGPAQSPEEQARLVPTNLFWEAMNRIVAIYEDEVSVDDGGLISYRSNREEMVHRGAQDPQGSKARRSPRRATHQVQVSDQSEDREGAWTDDPAVRARACTPSD